MASYLVRIFLIPLSTYFLAFPSCSINKYPSFPLTLSFFGRMMPEDQVYGPWPKSGEIDIMESRGNSAKTYNLGRGTASSALHWGLSFSTDIFLDTVNQHYLRRADYSQAFHIFGLEWSEKYLYTYIDNRLAQVVSVQFSGTNMWIRSGLSAEGYA